MQSGKKASGIVTSRQKSARAFQLIARLFRYIMGAVYEILKNEVTRMLPSGFVSITDVIPDALLEIRYYSAYNFVGSRIDGYEMPVALLTREAAQALKGAADEARALGFCLRIYDAYRPQRAVDHFVRWAADIEDTRMRPCFYPDVDKTRLFDLGFIARRSGHTRGSTVDLTLLDAKTGFDLDMGGPFDFFGPLSHPDYAGVTEKQRANRMLLRDLMQRHGFRGITTEWWHFTLKDEPYPDTYFDHPVCL